MDCLKCPANLRYEVVTSLMEVLVVVAVASLSGDEPKYKEKVRSTRRTVAEDQQSGAAGNG